MLTDVQRQAAEDLINERLPNIVESISIEEAVDSDEEPIVRIMIVFKPNVKPDTQQMVSLARHLRTRIEDDDIFPLIDFISAADAAKRRRASR